MPNFWRFSKIVWKVWLKNQKRLLPILNKVFYKTSEELYFDSHSRMRNSACSISFSVILISMFTVLNSLCKVALEKLDSSLRLISAFWIRRMSRVSFAFLYCDLYRLQGAFMEIKLGSS
jgi:hypothetical protein